MALRSLLGMKSPEEKAAEAELEAVRQERAQRITAAEQAVRDYYARVAPKWEYYFVYAWYDSKEKAWKVYYEGQVCPYDEINDVLDYLGKRGWELVHVTSSVSSRKESFTTWSYTDTTGETFIFKRQNPTLPAELEKALADAQSYGKEYGL